MKRLGFVAVRFVNALLIMMNYFGAERIYALLRRSRREDDSRIWAVIAKASTGVVNGYWRLDLSNWRGMSFYYFFPLLLILPAFILLWLMRLTHRVLDKVTHF